MLEIKNASLKVGGTDLFCGLSFAVDDGGMVCVMGPSGSGKTTLLRTLLGFRPLDGGHVSIDGELLTPSSAEEFRKIMAYVPQEVALPTEWVADMVAMLFSLKINRGTAFSKPRLMEEWSRLGLDPSLYDRRVAELSGGERQRVMLSVAGLLARPILLADEPTSALDAEAAALVGEYLRRMADGGSTVVVVTHDERLAAYCDRRIMMTNEGPADGTVEDE